MVSTAIAYGGEIALSLLLIPRFGILGGAFAVLVALAGLFFAGLIQVRILLKLWPYDLRFGRGSLRLLLLPSPYSSPTCSRFPSC